MFKPGLRRVRFAPSVAASTQSKTWRAVLARRAPASPAACVSHYTSMLNAVTSFYLEHEAALHTAGAWIMIGVGTIVLVTELCGVVAPYGRHGMAGSSWFGPLINAKVAWAVQESGAFLVPAALLCFGEPRCLHSWTNWLLLRMFMVHYFQRSFIYPPLMRGAKPMPIGICFLALTFCVFNGWLQGRLWTALEVREVPTSAADAACLGLGFSLWAAGFAINLHADSVLRGLRKTPGDTAYYVPRGERDRVGASHPPAAATRSFWTRAHATCACACHLHMPLHMYMCTSQAHAHVTCRWRVRVRFRCQLLRRARRVVRVRARCEARSSLCICLFHLL